MEDQTMFACSSNPATTTNALPTLLGLPAELRNLIYDHIIYDVEKARFSEHGLVPHALARTCRQTREEFYPIYRHAADTAIPFWRVRVVDFDFKPFITYLKVLAPIKPPRSQDLKGRSLERIRFEIVITEAVSTKKVRRVERWLEFCEHDENFRWLMDLVPVSYYVECAAFEGAERVFLSLVATLGNLWEFCAKAGDQSRIMEAMEMAEFRLQAKITQYKGLMRKRKRDGKLVAMLYDARKAAEGEGIIER
ncbi:hypothetical protein LTR85_001309 [Meristemomyces frigidus]|nr:hypothetical protein LTR85_001309 [Meristemomyces frigidus]